MPPPHLNPNFRRLAALAIKHGLPLADACPVEGQSAGQDTSGAAPQDSRLLALLEAMAQPTASVTEPKAACEQTVSFSYLATDVLGEDCEWHRLPYLHVYLVPAGAPGLVPDHASQLPPGHVEQYALAHTVAQVRLEPALVQAADQAHRALVPVSADGMPHTIMPRAVDMPMTIVARWLMGTDRRWSLATGSLISMSSKAFGWSFLVGPRGGLMQRDPLQRQGGVEDPRERLAVFRVYRTETQEQQFQTLRQELVQLEGRAEEDREAVLAGQLVRPDPNTPDKPPCIATFHLQLASTGQFLCPDPS